MSEKETSGIESRLEASVSRREFLKVAGIAGAGITLTGGLGGLLAACGEAEETTTTAGATTTTAAATTTTAGATTTTAAGSTTTVSAGNTKLEAFMATVKKEIEPLLVKPPVEKLLNEATLAGPKNVGPGKKVMFIPIILAGCDTCVTYDAQQKIACDGLGWNYQTINPMGDSQKIANALDQSIAMKMDALITLCIMHDTALEPLKKVKAAGIILGTYASSGSPCTPNQEQVYQYDSTQADAWDLEGWLAGAAAWYNLGMGEAPVHALLSDQPGFQISDGRTGGFRRFITEAADAGVDSKLLGTVVTTAAELGDGTAGKKTAQMIQQYPDYTLMYGGEQVLISTRAAQTASGVYDTKKVWTCVDLTPVGVADMRAGGCIKTSCGTPISWCAWTTIDDTNRMFSGQPALSGDGRAVDPAQKSTIHPRMVITKDVLPVSDKEAWDTYMNDPLKEAFFKLWGVA